MIRLGEIDLRDSAPLPRPVTSVAFAGLCTFGFVVLRTVIDSAWPGAGPFALAYPAILVATLFAGPLCGGLTFAGTFLYGWYFGLPVFASFVIQNPLDQPRLVINALSGLMIVAVTQAFRQSAREARRAREKQIEDRTLFIREIEHRVANNFATVAAVLRLQARRSGEPQVGAMLEDLVARVESIARSHRHLYAAGDFDADVDMRAYVEALADSLSGGLLGHTAVTLAVRVSQGSLPRDRAVLIGVIINELVTNALKHAFPEGSPGKIDVTLEREGGAWRLLVQDDGRGFTNGGKGGLGRQLLEDLVRQAGGAITLESAPGQGSRYAITVAAT